MVHNWCMEGWICFVSTHSPNEYFTPVRMGCYPLLAMYIVSQARLRPEAPNVLCIVKFAKWLSFDLLLGMLSARGGLYLCCTPSTHLCVKHSFLSLLLLCAFGCVWGCLHFGQRRSYISLCIITNVHAPPHHLPSQHQFPEWRAKGLQLAHGAAHGTTAPLVVCALA